MDLSLGKSKAKPITYLIVSLLVIGVLVFVISKDMEGVREFIRQSGWVGLLICVGLYGILGLSPIPSEPLTILISTIFGPWQATLVAGFGNMLAALIEYYIGLGLADVSSFDKQREKLPFNLGKFPVDSPVFLIAARMLPGYGPKFISVLSGVYRVPLFRYLWTAAIPTFIGAAIFAYGGFGLINLQQE